MYIQWSRGSVGFRDITLHSTRCPSLCENPMGKYYRGSRVPLRAVRRHTCQCDWPLDAHRSDRTSESPQHERMEGWEERKGIRDNRVSPLAETPMYMRRKRSASRVDLHCNIPHVYHRALLQTFHSVTACLLGCSCWLAVPPCLMRRLVHERARSRCSPP